jgi:DNA-binding MarR family transcriptional regulator
VSNGRFVLTRTRRDVLCALQAADSHLNVTELARRTSIDIATVSRILAVLEQHGWLDVTGPERRQGVRRKYRLAPQAHAHIKLLLGQ